MLLPERSSLVSLELRNQESGTGPWKWLSVRVRTSMEAAMSGRRPVISQSERSTSSTLDQEAGMSPSQRLPCMSSIVTCGGTSGKGPVKELPQILIPSEFMCVLSEKFNGNGPVWPLSATMKRVQSSEHAWRPAGRGPFTRCVMRKCTLEPFRPRHQSAHGSPGATLLPSVKGTTPEKSEPQRLMVVRLSQPSIAAHTLPPRRGFKNTSITLVILLQPLRAEMSPVNACKR
mmetsp:Transcript_86442/g.239691  ORF Transcript_86442/g.239691 Transcript_86442/m.239691 type:complete len:231 (+) Transcript_86442:899-1591(+)